MIVELLQIKTFSPLAQRNIVMYYVWGTIHLTGTLKGQMHNCLDATQCYVILGIWKHSIVKQQG